MYEAFEYFVAAVVIYIRAESQVVQVGIGNINVMTS